MSTHAHSLRPSHARRGIPAYRWALLRLTNVWRARLERHELVLAQLITGLVGFIAGALFVYACVAYMIG